VSSTRRTFLAQALCSPVGLPCPAIGRPSGRKVSQDELTWAIDEHSRWLLNDGRGVRAAFADHNLSGLDFSAVSTELTNLRGADFTRANLVGTTADNVSFWHASLHGADLSFSHFKRPGFIQASLRSAVCEGVVWGYDEIKKQPLKPHDPQDVAVFHHTDASGLGTFTNAAIRGSFFNVNFSYANLTGANLSSSILFGSGLSCQNSFFAANLSRAQLAATEISLTRFCNADLSDADFTSANIGPNVSFRGAVGSYTIPRSVRT
jgi:uncharacterized protein YjbI with pentapeptide repeats